MCAESISSVISARVGDNMPDNSAAERLALDLSGWYRPFAVQLVGQHSGTVRLDGSIYDDPRPNDRGDIKPVGGLTRRFCRDGESRGIVAHHDLLYLYNGARRRGFSTKLWLEIEPYYRKSGVERIELLAALDDGGYVWARAGYVWDRDPEKLEKSLENVRKRAEQMESRLDATPADQALLRAVIDSLYVHIDDLPMPQQLAALSTPDSPNLGRTLLRGAHWYGVRYL
jgi:GNAT superfamily N-acetyltransferase